MTRYTPLWQQAGTYPAATDRGLISAVWPATGATPGAITTVTNTMNVSIPAGAAAVSLAAGAGTELCRWDTAEVVTLTAAPPAGQSRIDLIVLQVRDNAVDAGGNNDFIFQAIAGTPTTGTPTAPAAPTNAMAVCQLTVAGGAANLNGVTVTDRRAAMGITSVGILTDGGLRVLGAQSRFGGGANGADQSWFGMGHYDPDNAIVAAGNDTRTVTNLIFQTKGNALFLFRDGGANTRVQIDTGSGVGGEGNMLVNFDFVGLKRILSGAPGTGPGGIGRALFIN